MFLEENQRVVDLNKLILNELGIETNEETYILEFGCGSGRHVYEYRDNGYKNIYGFDIKNYVELRDERDSTWFKFSKDKNFLIYHSLIIILILCILLQYLNMS